MTHTITSVEELRQEIAYLEEKMDYAHTQALSTDDIDKSDAWFEVLYRLNAEVSFIRKEIEEIEEMEQAIQLIVKVEELTNNK